MPATSKKLSQKQLIASLIVDEDVAAGQAIYLIKTPRFGAKHTGDTDCVCYGCHPTKGQGLGMYGLYFTEGAAITTDKALAEKIVAEFPDYKMEELA